jgi:sugar phosphate permease
VSGVCCQVEVSATSWSLVQRSPTDCGVSQMCVTMKPRRNEEAQTHKGLSSHRKKKYICTYVYVCMCVCIYVYVYIRVYVCIYMNLCMFVYACTVNMAVKCFNFMVSRYKFTTSSGAIVSGPLSDCGVKSSELVNAELERPWKQTCRSGHTIPACF